MTHRSTAILLLTAFVLQALVGGFGRYGAVCLSNGHSESVLAETCISAHACSHESDPPRLSVHDKHEDDCGCVDIELDCSDSLAVQRTSTGELLCVRMARYVPCLIATLPDETELRGPIVPPDDDFAVSLGLAAVTCTRLTL